MIIVPAIDIKEGMCVRLLQGRMDSKTVFSDDPVSMATRWEQEGAEILHVVDLDGAVEQQPRNKDVIERIVKGVKIDVQVGGGIRNRAAIEMYLGLGVRRIVIGTEAIRNPQMVMEVCKAFPGQIVLGIDARNGLVAIEGWTRTTELSAVELAKTFQHSGITAINFTDIHRDGMQTGLNIEETKRLAEAVDVPVFASGGVSSIDDIKRLLPLESVGISGVIIGKALYSGNLNLREAIKAAIQ